jgi:hypothetical protein
MEFKNNKNEIKIKKKKNKKKIDWIEKKKKKKWRRKFISIRIWIVKLKKKISVRR